jgi:hypothetical protein
MYGLDPNFMDIVKVWDKPKPVSVKYYIVSNKWDRIRSLKVLLR